MFIKDTKEWAQQTYGPCDLGDTRRVARLIDYACAQADNPQGSTNRICNGDDAAAEGAYRLLRNDAVHPSDIDEGAFHSTAKQCEGRKVLLAIQDTTSVEVLHRPLREIVAQKGSPTGFVVHSTLMVDGEKTEVIGIIDQQRWLREPNQPDEVKSPKVSYEERESYKWEAASERYLELLTNPESVITVCDREADIFEYIASRIDKEERFIIRAKNDRMTATDVSLFDAMNKFKILGQKTIIIPQRGESHQNRKVRRARPAREAVLEIRAGKVLIEQPRQIQGDGSLLPVNAVYVVELNPPEGCEPLEWRLLTSEPVETLEQAQLVIHYYEKRWLIEDFHKCWKTGCRAEKRPFQSFEAVERFLSISCHIAIRILQLHSLAQLSPEAPCGSILSDEEQQCLMDTSISRPERPSRQLAAETGLNQDSSSQPALNPSPPEQMSAREALLAIAKLGGWRDTKKTGRIGWQALWEGWRIFQERLLGWRNARKYYYPQTNFS
jgi:hypothetical protein